MDEATRAATADGLRRLAQLVETVDDVELKLHVFSSGTGVDDAKRIAALAHYASSFEFTPSEPSYGPKAVAHFEGLKVAVYGQPEHFGHEIQVARTVSEYVPFTVAELVERAEAVEATADDASAMAVGF